MRVLNENERLRGISIVTFDYDHLKSDVLEQDLRIFRCYFYMSNFMSYVQSLFEIFVKTCMLFLKPTKMFLDIVM